MKTESESNRQGVKVLIAGSVLQLFLGVIYVWSVFVAPVSVFFNWNIESVKLTSSFMLCCFVLGILLGGRLQMKIGAQKVVLAGGLAMAVGMLITSFVPAGAAWLIYVSYGIIGGFGVGMAYNAIISCAQKWFPKKRGLATGISVCMFGFSTVIFAPLVKALIGYNNETKVFDNFGPLVTFRILAAAFGLVTLALFTFVKLPPNTGSAAAADISGQKQFTTGEMLKTRQFYYIALSMMLFTAAYFILNPSFITLSEARGLDASVGLILVQITGVANALGRLATPMLADKIGREKATFTIIALTVISTALLSFATGYLFLASVAVIAFCYGGSSGVYPLVTSEYFGLKNIGSNYGAVMVGFMLSALFFPMIIGLITDATVKFIILAIMAAISAVLVVLLAMSKNNKKSVKE